MDELNCKACSQTVEEGNIIGKKIYCTSCLDVFKECLYCEKKTSNSNDYCFNCGGRPQAMFCFKCKDSTKKDGVLENGFFTCSTCIKEKSKSKLGDFSELDKRACDKLKELQQQNSTRASELEQFKQKQLKKQLKQEQQEQKQEQQQLDPKVAKFLGLVPESQKRSLDSKVSTSGQVGQVKKIVEPECFECKKCHNTTLKKIQIGADGCITAKVVRYWSEYCSQCGYSDKWTEDD